MHANPRNHDRQAISWRGMALALSQSMETTLKTSKTLAVWHATITRTLDRARGRAYPDHKHPCGSSTITGRTFHY